MAKMRKIRSSPTMQGKRAEKEFVSDLYSSAGKILLGGAGMLGGLGVAAFGVATGNFPLAMAGAGGIYVSADIGHEGAEQFQKSKKELAKSRAIDGLIAKSRGGSAAFGMRGFVPPKRFGVKSDAGSPAYLNASAEAKAAKPTPAVKPAQAVARAGADQPRSDGMTDGYTRTRVVNGMRITERVKSYRTSKR